MGLFQKAIETYDAMHDLVGVKNEELQEILAPIGYMTATAKIEITVDANGNFVRARKIEEKIAIPCTEESSGRTSKPVPHPLCANIEFVTELDKTKHSAFLKEINAWRLSEYGNSKIDAIYKYLSKGEVFKDCQDAGLLTVESQNSKKKNDKKTIKEEKDLVTWRVEGLGENSGAVQEDEFLKKNYFKYYLEQKKDSEGICMITGNKEPLARQHLRGVFNSKGKAKLISANDNLNYTFRGRFIDSCEALTMGYFSSQKAHNALKWLLTNFGVGMGARVMICWSPKGRKIPKFNLPLLDKSETKVEPSDYRKKLSAILNGHRGELPQNNTVVMAAFDAATSGRLAITYYNELTESDFVKRLYYWDSTCCWYDQRRGVQSPYLYKIIDLAFGTQQDNGEVKCDSRVQAQQMQRLVSCRLDKALFPKDIMRNLVVKASNLKVYKNHNVEDILFVTCAVIKKCRHDYFKEDWEMALDENSIDRSYQFGRLLAVLEMIERQANGTNGNERETNAIRTQVYYVRRPLTAFSQIMTSLKTGYYPKLSIGARTYFEKLIGEIIEKISTHTSKEELDKPLTETYLMGYYLQKNALYSKKDNEKVEEE